MARGIQKLSALQVAREKKPGYFADGGGLHLQVTKAGTKSWLFRFMRNKRLREMGLGPVHTVSLAEARIKAAECRKLLLEGIDPIDARKAHRATANVEAAKTFTFDQCADAFIEANRPDWKNAKHADQWKNTIATYCSPIFGALPVAAVNTALVMKALEPIWREKNETAMRLRGRIESVLASWAAKNDLHDYINPARWKNHLERLLPKISRTERIEHHPALPYTELGSFFVTLGEQEGIAARALEFAILTAGRTGEVIGAKWSEIDLKTRVWTIPSERMKAKKEHRSPLSSRAIEILKALAKEMQGDFVFAGRRENSALSNMAMLQLLKRMGRADLTVHGFRSTFRDWAAEQTNYPREVAEMALAHTVGDKVEAAYRRGDLFEKRRRMMEDWATYCNNIHRKTDNVVPLQKSIGAA